LDKAPFGSERIRELLPHRHPMLMIDRVLELGENYILAEKLVSSAEPALAGHFPGQPIFPGVLIIEAMAQAAALWAMSSGSVRAGMLCVLAGVDSVRFRRQVVPGDVLRLEARALAARSKLVKIEAKASVASEPVADAILLAAFVPRSAEGGA
jgi:3-hydroxyacyl-[acyl-carrier-protein] dehydratase